MRISCLQLRLSGGRTQLLLGDRDGIGGRSPGVGWGPGMHSELLHASSGLRECSEKCGP